MVADGGGFLQNLAHVADADTFGDIEPELSQFERNRGAHVVGVDRVQREQILFNRSGCVLLRFNGFAEVIQGDIQTLRVQLLDCCQGVVQRFSCHEAPCYPPCYKKVGDQIFFPLCFRQIQQGRPQHAKSSIR